MKILCLLVERGDTCAFYRSSGVIPDLRKKLGNEHTIDMIQMGEISINWPILNQYDTIFMPRPFTKDHLNTCGYLKYIGKKLWIDYDDDLFTLNPGNSARRLYKNPEIQAYIKAMLGLADVVSVPTEYLRQAYSEFNKNIVIVPNAFHDDIFKRPEYKPRTNSVVWRGGMAHEYDLYCYLNEINQLTTEFSNWRFMFMGPELEDSWLWWFLVNTTNKGQFPVLDIVPYFKELYDMAPSCLHVPLHDDPFNRAKSNIAYIEGSYAGAVCVVPSWWNVPGALSYTDGPSYYEAIKSVIKGEVDKVALNRISWEYIQDVLPLSKVNVDRLQIINSLI